MATANNLKRARVLVHLHTHQVPAGAILEASPDLIKSLAAVGDVDAGKEAVTYAAQSGAAVMRSAVELAQEASADARDEQLVEIAKLEQLLSEAKDDATRDAITADIEARKAAIATP